MRAVVYDACGATPTVREAARPVCPPDGVLVRVRATGVCRSDWHAWRGHDPVPLPMTPGHEWAGEVVETGPDLSGRGAWSVGDRVTAPFVLGCGRCTVCARGDQQVCPDQRQPGFTYPGSWAELLAVPAAAANLVALPPDLADVDAASLGCRFATAYRAVRVHGRVGAGTRVVVVGCGGVGQAAVMVAVALGAHVVAVDPSSAARRLAGELGAAEVVDPGAHVDPTDAVRSLAGGGAEVALDALGSAATARLSVASLTPRGRHVQVGLLLGDDVSAVPMDLVVARELEVLGSHGMPAGDYPEMLAMVADGRLDPGRLVGDVVDLAEGPRALAALDGSPARAGMTVLTL